MVRHQSRDNAPAAENSGRDHRAASIVASASSLRMSELNSVSLDSCRPRGRSTGARRECEEVAPAINRVEALVG